MDLPALVIDSTDVPMAEAVAQLRAIADGMAANAITDVRLTLFVKVTFRKVDP